MRKISGITLIAIMLICGFTLSTCNRTAMADTIGSFGIVRDCRIGQSNIDIVTDNKTGVQYILVSSQYTDSDGFDRQGITITPRLSSDGSLYVGN